MSVTGIQDIQSAIIDYMQSNWTATDIAWDNVDYEPSTGNEYIAIFLDPVDETPEAKNGSQNLYRIVGELTIIVYTQQGTGPGRNHELADDAASLFRGKDLDTVQFRGAAVNRVGIVDNGGWYKSLVRIEFYADLYQ